jgi:hypothetical protein
MTGIVDAAMARTTSSEEKGRRSSSDPPPLPTMMTSPSGVTVCDLDGTRDALRRPVTLHRGGQDDHVDSRVAPAQYAQDIAHRGACGRGDDGDAGGKKGELFLAIEIEQPLRGELSLQLLQHEENVPFPCPGQQGVADELVVASPGIDRDCSRSP